MISTKALCEYMRLLLLPHCQPSPFPARRHPLQLNKVKHLLCGLAPQKPPGFTMTLQSWKTSPLRVVGRWPDRTSLHLSWQLHLQLLKAKGKEEKKQRFKAKDGAHFVYTSTQGCNDLCCRPLETLNPIRTVPPAWQRGR